MIFISQVPSAVPSEIYLQLKKCAGIVCRTLCCVRAKREVSGQPVNFLEPSVHTAGLIGNHGHRNRQAACENALFGKHPGQRMCAMQRSALFIFIEHSFPAAASFTALQGACW